MKKERR